VSEELKLIPEGQYTCTVKDFGEVKQTKASINWYMPVELETGEYKIRMYLFGVIDTISLLLDNKERFINQVWTVRITHKTIDGRTYYNARRRSFAQLRKDTL
jgi:hypothetical protein